MSRRTPPALFLIGLAISLAAVIGAAAVTTSAPASAPTPTVTVTAPPVTLPPRTVYVERATRREQRIPPRLGGRVETVTPQRFAQLPSGVTGAAQRYARPLVSAAQWPCLRELWQRESGWSPRSRSGSHFGIAQRRGETATDYRTQVDRGLRYIAHRYGTPCRALAAHDRKGWY